MAKRSMPQWRVLNELMASSSEKNAPLVTRHELAKRAGFVPTSGTINRAIHGIRKGSSSGKPHKGLLQLGLIRVVDVHGKNYYQITSEGQGEIQQYFKNGGTIPPLRSKDVNCVNYRYQAELLEDIIEIKDETTKKALQEIRVGQEKFRKEVLKLWGNSCSVTGSKLHSVIEASHIKPWNESNNVERLDPNNGLPLIPNLHALFDDGLITFDSSGMLIISTKVSKTERDIFGIGATSLIRKPSPKTAKYLEYHRTRKFDR